MTDIIKFLLLAVGIIGLPLVWIVGIRLYARSAQGVFDGMEKDAPSELRRFGWPLSGDEAQASWMSSQYERITALKRGEVLDRSAVLGKVWVWGLPACQGVSAETKRAARGYRIMRTAGTLFFFGAVPYLIAFQAGPALLILGFSIFMPPDKFIPWKSDEGIQA